MALAVLVVVCGKYREMGLGNDVKGVEEATRFVHQAVADLGGTVRTIPGKVTERRLGRALRGLGKRARAGHEVAVVFLGHEVDGAMAPENTAIRKPGKRMRTFSRERVAREIGGSLIRGGTDVLACGRVAQLVREPPKMGPTQMNPEFVRAALEAAMARLTKPDQLDAGYNGYWVFVDNQWSPGHKGVVGARARADLFAIPVGDPPVRIGLFELEVQEDGLHEAWFFTDNQWPNTDFRLDYIGTLAAWNAAPQWRSGRLPVTQLGWKGFNAEPESTGETLPTAVCLSTTPDVDHATVYGNLVEANGVRVVSHWRSSDGQTLHISPNQDRIWAFVRQNRTLSSPYRPIA